MVSLWPRTTSRGETYLARPVISQLVLLQSYWCSPGTRARLPATAVIRYGRSSSSSQGSHWQDSTAHDSPRGECKLWTVQLLMDRRERTAPVGRQLALQFFILASKYQLPQCRTPNVWYINMGRRRYLGVQGSSDSSHEMPHASMCWGPR